MMTEIQHGNEWQLWFAWYPVRLGAIGTGRIAWLRKVMRFTCQGITIYQPLELFEEDCA